MSANVRFSPESALTAPVDLLAWCTSGDVPSLKPLADALGASLQPLLDDARFQGKPGDAVVIPTFGKLGARKVALIGLGDASPGAVASAAARFGALAREQRAANLGWQGPATDANAVRSTVEHVLVGAYAYQQFLPADRKSPDVASLTIFGTAPAGAEAAVQNATISARYQALARDLVNLPPANLYPETLADHARRVAAELPGVDIEVWDEARCEAEGLVGLIAVGQGSSRQPRMIRLSYRPNTPVDHIALVGKGITFDSGGLSLKPSASMQTMRCDMGGAATMLAAFGAIAALKLPIAVDCFLAAAENMVSGNSFKLGDILTYRNGVTVEIHNTDAEGRLVLADALILASEIDGVSRIVDAATLTGAAVIAVGPDITALFTGHEALAAELSDASRAASEDLWRLPLHQPYKRMLKGKWSQIKNVGGRPAGSTTAALFLQHFVRESAAWAHLDIAGSSFTETAEGPYAPGGTGRPVRTLIRWAEAIAITPGA